jgi:hypothetical protein
VPLCLHEPELGDLVPGLAAQGFHTFVGQLPGAHARDAQVTADSRAFEAANQHGECLGAHLLHARSRSADLALGPVGFLRGLALVWQQVWILLSSRRLSNVARLG